METSVQKSKVSGNLFKFENPEQNHLLKNATLEEVSKIENPRKDSIAISSGIISETQSPLYVNSRLSPYNNIQ